MLEETGSNILVKKDVKGLAKCSGWADGFNGDPYKGFGK